MQAVYGETYLLKTHVYEWADRFKNGRESVGDDTREGAPKTTRSDRNAERLRVLVKSDRRLTLCMSVAELAINKKTIRIILHDDLRMRKLREIGALMTKKHSV